MSCISNLEAKLQGSIHDAELPVGRDYAFLKNYIYSLCAIKGWLIIYWGQSLTEKKSSLTLNLKHKPNLSYR